MLTFRNHTRPVLVLVMVLTASLAGCTTPGGSSTPEPPAVSVAPHITLSAPPSVEEHAPISLTIDSSGHDGEQVQVYGFFSQYDTPANCTQASTPVSVTLTGGQQSIDMSSIVRGAVDEYWIVSGNGFISDCGAVRTRLLAAPEAAIASIGDSGYLGEGLGASTGITISDVKSYRIEGRGFPEILAGQGEVQGTVEWVGPFQTAPEAEASPCPTTPVAVTDVFTLVLSTEHDASTGLTTAVDQPLSITVPGVYRVLLSLPATGYTVAIVPDCANSMLITAK